MWICGASKQLLLMETPYGMAPISMDQFNIYHGMGMMEKQEPRMWEIGEPMCALYATGTTIFWDGNSMSEVGWRNYFPDGYTHVYIGPTEQFGEVLCDSLVYSTGAFLRHQGDIALVQLSL
jgi:hypothetical protein